MNDFTYSEPTVILDVSPDEPGRKLAPHDLIDHGVLWAINSQIFHPKGYALCMVFGENGFQGFELVGDGSVPWRFDESVGEDAKREAFDWLLATTAEAHRQ